MIPAIERGYPQTEIANASYEYQHEIETGEQKIVGVNAFTDENEQPIELLQIDETAQRRQEEKLAALRARRDQPKVAKALDDLRRAAEGSENTMPYILDAVRSYATVGEICDAFRDVFGVYTENSVL
jgi:methylmalonyl-CoA mutase N-terminal domain/subunit